MRGGAAELPAIGFTVELDQLGVEIGARGPQGVFAVGEHRVSE
jgi:hypothetical protein